MKGGEPRAFQPGPQGTRPQKQEPAQSAGEGRVPSGLPALSSLGRGKAEAGLTPTPGCLLQTYCLLSLSGH